MLDTSATESLRSRAAPPSALSLADMLEVLRRRWLPVLLAIGFAMGAGGIYLLAAKPSYSAIAQIMIDTKRSDSPGAQFVTVDTAVVESQIETIKTDKVVVAVIKKLALDEDPEFIAPGRLAHLLAKFRLARLEQPLTAQARLRRTIAKFRRELNVTRIGPSYLANIAFSSVDPDKAAHIANEIADAYIEDQLSARALSAERANSWMQKRAADLRQQADLATQAADNSSGEQKQQLEAAAQTARRAYETFMSVTRYTQNSSERAFPVTEARIMSAAVPPMKRTTPNTPIILGMSLLAGCLLGSMLALALEWLDHSIRTRDQVEREAGLRVLGFLPIIEKRRRPNAGAYVGAPRQWITGILAGFSWRAKVRARSAVSLSSWPGEEQLVRVFDERPARTAKMLLGLRHMIDNSIESQSGRIIGITSPRSGDGKTTLAFNLAWFIAQSRSRVILLDANLPNPSLTRILAPKNNAWRSALVGEQTASKIPVISLEYHGFDLLEDQQCLAARHSPTSLGFPAMKKTLEELRQEYDYVIVDLPPVLGHVDVRTCAGLLDGVIMLVRFGRTTMDDLVEALGEFTLTQGRLLGAVGNTKRVPERRAHR